MLLTIDLDEDLINVEGVAVAPVLSLQSSGVQRTEFDAPEANRFAGDSYATLSQQIFDISVAQIEAIVKPDCVTYDIGWESVAFICIHRWIIPFPAFNLSVPSLSLRHEPDSRK